MLVLFGLLSAWGARGMLRLEPDPQNTPMHSVGTPEARSIQLRNGDFPPETKLVLLLESRDGSALDAGSEEVRDWLAALRGLPAVRNLVVAPEDAPGALVAVADLVPGEDGSYAEQTRGAINSARAHRPKGTRVFAAGHPVAEIVLARELASEEDTTVPRILVVLLVTLLLIYRSPVTTLGAFLPSLGAILLAGGLQHALGFPKDPISTLLAPTLLSIGVATSVHLFEHLRAHRARGASLEEALTLSVRELRRPTILTALTTLAGFLGLTTNPIPAVARFGLFAGLGVVLASFFALTVLPAWLLLFSRRRPPVRPALAAARHLEFTRGVERHAGLVIGVCLAAAVGLGLAWTRLRVDTTPIKILPPDDELRVATERISEVLGGVDTFDLLLPPPAPALAPLHLAELAAEVTAIPGVVTQVAPPRKSDGGTWLSTFLIEPSGTATREALFARAEAVARDQGWADPIVTGETVQMARDSERLVRGQLEGLGLTVLLVALSMAIGLGSLRLGLLGLIPNVLPCVAVYGGMALAGRSLSVATAMIGSVMLGVIVDDTVHLLHTYAAERRGGLQRHDAIAAALGRVGRPVVITSLVLFLGLGVGVTGRLETTRAFSLLAALIVATALLANLFLLPALLTFRHRGAET